MGYSGGHRQSGTRMMIDESNSRSGPGRTRTSVSYASSGGSNSSAPPSLSSRFGRIEQERSRQPPAAPSGAGHGKQQRQAPVLRMPGGGSRPVGSSSRRGTSRSAPAPQQSRGVRKAGRSSNMMEVDQGPQGRPMGRFPMTQQGNRGKRGGRGGAAPAGGRQSGRGGSVSRGGRGGRGGKRGPQPTRENLDVDLDKYMMKDAGTAKHVLDNDLDSYMMGATDLPQQIG